MQKEQFDLLMNEIRETKEDTAQKFDVLIQEIKGINNKLSEHDKKFEKMDKKLSEHDKKFEQIDQNFEQIDKNFDFVIKGLNGVKQIQELFGKRQELMAIRQDQEFKFLVTEIQKIKNDGEEYYV